MTHRLLHRAMLLFLTKGQDMIAACLVFLVYPIIAQWLLDPKKWRRVVTELLVVVAIAAAVACASWWR